VTNRYFFLRLESQALGGATISVNPIKMTNSNQSDDNLGSKH